MADYPDIQTWKRAKLTELGLDHTAYDITPNGEVVPVQAAAPAAAPDVDSPVTTAAKSFGWSLPEAAAGLIGAGAAGQAFSAGLDATGVGLPAGVAGHVISAVPMLVGAGLAAYGANKAKTAIAPGIDANVAASAAANPIAAKVGSLGAQAVGLRPSPAMLKSAVSGLRNFTTGAGVSAAERAALANVGGGAAIGAGTDVAEQLAGDKPYDPLQTLESTVTGGVFSQPTKVGEALTGLGNLLPRGKMHAWQPGGPNLLAEGKKIIAGARGAEPTDYSGDVFRPGEERLAETDQRMGLPRRPGEAWNDYTKRLAAAKVAQVQEKGEVIGGGEQRYGVADTARDEQGVATARISPDAFHNTAPHEMLHQYIQDVRTSGTPAEKEFVEAGIRHYGGEEAFVQAAGEHVLSRLGEKGGDSYFRDLWAHVKHKLGAGDADYARGMSNRLLRGRGVEGMELPRATPAPPGVYTEDTQTRGTHEEFQGASESPTFSTDFEKELDKPRPWNIQVSTKDGRMSANDVRAAVAKLSPTEQEMLKEAGLGNYLSRVVRPNAAELKAWAEQNVPRVEVKPLYAFENGERPKSAKRTAADREVARLQHEMDTAGINYGEDMDGNVVVMRRDGTRIDEPTAAQIRLATQLRDAEYHAGELRNADAVRDGYRHLNDNDSATRQYTMVNPRELKDMPGAVDLLVRMPRKDGGKHDDFVDKYGKLPTKAGYEWDGKSYKEAPKYPADSTHYPESGDNLLAHVRAYEHTMPNGEKVLRVFEVQSDWAQARRKQVAEQLEIIKNQEVPGKALAEVLPSRSQLGKIVGELGIGYMDSTDPKAQQQLAEYLAKAPNDPLLAHHQRLALKAAIEHARSRGISKVVIDDADTAMLTEGHDRAAQKQLKPFRTEQEARNFANTLGRTPHEITQAKSGVWHVKYSEIGQERGMRLAYDNVLQQHMRELAGEGAKVEMGEHKNAVVTKEEADDIFNTEAEARRFAGLDGYVSESPAGGEWHAVRNRNTHAPRPDLIFRNPDGTPKTTSTGWLYDVSAPQARRAAGEPFSYAGRKYQGADGEEPTPGTRQSIDRYGVEEDARRIVRAVAAGTKPLALMNTSELRVIGDLPPGVELHTIGGRRYLTRIGDRAAAEDLAKIVDQPSGSAEEHMQRMRTLGEKLGYTKREIDEFLAQPVISDVLHRRKYQGADGEKPYGFWVDRDGNMIPVGQFGHKAIARKLLAEKHGVAEPLLVSNGMMYGTMFDLGYVRGARVGDSYVYDSPKPLTNAQRRAIRNHAIEAGLSAEFRAHGETATRDIYRAEQRYQGGAADDRDPITGAPRVSMLDKFKTGASRIFDGLATRMENSGMENLQYAAGKMRELFARGREIAAQYNDPMQKALEALNPAEIKALHNALMTEDQMQQEKTPRSLRNSLSAKNRVAYDTIRATLRKMAEDRVAAGHTLWNGEERGVTEHYFPNMMRSEIRHVLTERPGSAEYNALKDEFIAFNEKLFTTRGMDAEEASRAALNAWGKYEGRMTAPSWESMLKYGPTDLPANSKLPGRWIEPDLSRLLQRYTNNFGRAAARHDVLETDDRMRMMLGMPAPSGTAYTPEMQAANPSLMRHPDFTKMLEVFGRGGMPGSSESVMPAAGRFINSLLISGPRTKITDGLTTLFKATPFVPLRELPGMVANIANFRGSFERSFANGLNNRTGQIVMREVLGAGEASAHFFDKLAEGVVKYTGSEQLERLARGLAQNVGEYIVRVNRPLALAGDARALRVMKHLGADWQTQSIDNLGGRMARVFQGSYDVTNLPPWMFDSPVAPFMTMMKWSLEQQNNFKKFAWEPALKGDYAPLLSTIVAGVGGGLILNEVREKLSGKREQNPTFAEIAAAKDNTAASLELMAKFMKYAQITGTMGLMSEIGSQAMDAANGRLPQGFKYPLAGVVADAGERALSAVDAIASGEPMLKVIGAVAADTARANVQMVQFTDGMAAELGIDAAGSAERKKENEARRDLRVFNRLNGYPVQSNPVRFAPYSGLSQKEFGKADPAEAAKLAPGLVKKAIADAHGDPELMKSNLRKLVAASNPYMPSIENNPLKFARYAAWVRQTQSEAAAKKKVADYASGVVKQRAREQMVPTGKKQ
jgi:hypothetical protein